MCVGTPLPPSGTIDAPIGRDETSTVRRCVRPDGAAAVSHYQVLAVRDGLTLVALLPETGRTHQLRVHMASIGCPLAGDWLYGTEDPNLIVRPALHSPPDADPSRHQRTSAPDRPAAGRPDPALSGPCGCQEVTF